MREMHPRLGFQQSLFREDYRGTDKIGMGLSDAEFLRQTLRRLEDLPRPFLAFLMTLSTHHPYEIPEREVRLRLPHDLQDTVLGRYLQAVHYTDGAIGEFVRELEAGGLLDQTVLVIYGDHAAHLGLGDDYFLGRVLEQHADWGPSTRGEFDATLWRARHTVPLLIHLPGDAAAARRFGSAGHLDIAPTLLNLLGIEGHEMVGLGRDLTRGENSVVVFRDGSFVEGSAYCRPATTNGERPGCWDARTGQAVDPTPYRSRFDQAREHLEVSDLLVTGDLIPRR
jgi:phosphoglycerol transferase MdoB-like AlkP superfamily enzyme